MDFLITLVSECWDIYRADALAGVQARLCSVREITEDLEGVSGAALVGVNPVISCRDREREGGKNVKPFFGVGGFGLTPLPSLRSG